MDILSFLPLFAGIGLFLYGMNLLAKAIERLAGAKLEKTLETLTSNKWKGLALGTGVTAIIQSSAATTITVVGFVNAGMMKLTQALPVIFGANIGSTATAQILRLGDLESGGLFLSLLKPSAFAPIIIAVGAGIMLMAKRKKTKNIANLLLGFGILFWGMTTMENTLSPLRNDPNFQKLFLAFENPLLGILVGALVTAVIQSSSASVGILQALSSTGTVSFAMAFPLILGQNIGKCLAVILASFGTSRNSKRAVLVHLLFNIFGVILFACGMYGLNAVFHFTFFSEIVNRGDIATIHTGFNLITALVLMPFVNALARLSEHLIKEDESLHTSHALDYLDELFLKNPGVALEQCKKVLYSMGDSIQENLTIAESLLLDKYDLRQLAQLEENERFLDKCEASLGEYLVKVTRHSLSEQESHEATEILQCVSDYERIGDYCVNISETAEYMSETNIAFTEQGMREARILFEAVHNIVNETLAAFQTEEKDHISSVEPLEEAIDAIIAELRNHHIERLQKGTCAVDTGISFIELLNNVERISDHCSNIAVYIVQKQKVDEDFDRHSYLKAVHRGELAGYQERFNKYCEQYLVPLLENKPKKEGKS
ncbi:Na/Pi cotransporter family protein [Cuneatibacter sp. NSJ-177]|uniref:Na/Pi cotransporter family protein n=1 Tax=Cuneatibacter sp. NSJ-177 TaxID=2931401 RepID=UPI001FD31DC3|nr:Na/Pi cotransporter family protein [Cuneatibacter sp. NSJ-177]MCJ7835148.1 Na/Pi cotransporter family protein [Cuneatibacter sp. NSJ-177]